MKHHPQKFTRRRILAMLACIPALPSLAYAQFERSTRFIVASSAGSSIDAVARLTQPAISKQLNSPLVVENIAGAGSIIAMQTLARSAPDGSVLAFQTNNMVTAPLLMRSPPYNAVEDFTPIAMVGSIPLVLVVNSKRIDATNAEEFIELLKQKGGQLNFGSSGPGTTLHLAVEMIAQEIGVKLNHIPYKGVGPMVTDLVAGQIDFAVSALPPVHGHIKSNALRSIGLLTEQRIVAAPEIPTFAEQGFPNFIMDVWMAVLGPSKMPAETVKKVHDAVLASFNDPSVKNTIEKQGNIVKVSTPEEALEKIRSDVQRYTDMAKKINLVAH